MTKKRTLLLSALTALLGVSVAVGASYALFTDQVTVNNHLSAGSLDVGLYRVEYKENVLVADGTMAESTPDTTRVDLTQNADKLFVIDDLFVPTSWYETTVEVSNSGDVAFDYGVRILWKDDPANDKDQIIAEQIQITISVGDTQKEQFYLCDCADYDVVLGSMLKGDAAEQFTVKAEFVNRDANNAAMQAEIEFDLQVYATQKTNG
jgi:predicted ribosomally synthesized peptide with SipW-like signal peptide